MCNGHANTCNVHKDHRLTTRILACQCQHNTCGIQCAECCPGFEQKKWRQNTNARPFQCERTIFFIKYVTELAKLRRPILYIFSL